MKQTSRELRFLWTLPNSKESAIQILSKSKTGKMLTARADGHYKNNRRDNKNLTTSVSWEQIQGKYFSILRDQ